MGKKKAKIPKPPDPTVVANAQSAANIATARETAKLNRLDQATPYGTVRYFNTGNPNAPYGVRSDLDPLDQQFLNRIRSTSLSHHGQVHNALNGGMSDEAVFRSMIDRLAPQMRQDESALRTRLANQGISIGSDAYNDEMDRLKRGENDLRLAAVQRAGAESRANRGQLLAEMAALRGAMPGAPVIQTPFAGVANTDTTTPTMNNYNQQMAAALNAQQSNSGMFGDIAGLAGTLGAAYFTGGGSLFGLGGAGAAGAAGFSNPAALGLTGLSLFG